MPRILSTAEIRELAAANDIELTNHWQPSSKGDAPPTLSSMTAWFKREAPVAWKALMSSLTEVPVSLRNTRIVSGSGAIDGCLMPCYAEHLADVNAARREVGFAPAHG